MEHILRCKDKSQNQWRKTFLSTLRDGLIAYQTKFALHVVMLTALEEWFRSGLVDPENYPIEYESAIQSQGLIGWKNFFLGKISRAWGVAQGQVVMSNGKVREPRSWSLMIVKTTLKQVINLWYQRNDDVHKINTVVRKQNLLSKLKDSIKDLLSMRPQCRATDEFLFPEDPEYLLNSSDEGILSRWILSRKPAILHSVKRAKESDIARTNPIYNFFQPTDPTNFQRAMRWKRDRLLHDPYNKKKRHKAQSLGQPQSSSIQTSIAKFLNPRKPL